MLIIFNLEFVKKCKIQALFSSAQDQKYGTLTENRIRSRGSVCSIKNISGKVPQIWYVP